MRTSTTGSDGQVLSLGSFAAVFAGDPPPAVAPEPGTLAAFVTGVMALFGLRRARRRKGN